MLESLDKKTVEEFKQSGASINVMEKVLKKFNIKAKFNDIDSNLIYKHDPVDLTVRGLFQRFSSKISFLHRKS